MAFRAEVAEIADSEDEPLSSSPQAYPEDASSRKRLTVGYMPLHAASEKAGLAQQTSNEDVSTAYVANGKNGVDNDSSTVLIDVVPPKDVFQANAQPNTRSEQDHTSAGRPVHEAALSTLTESRCTPDLRSSDRTDVTDHRPLQSVEHLLEQVRCSVQEPSPEPTIEPKYDHTNVGAESNCSVTMGRKLDVTNNSLIKFAKADFSDNIYPHASSTSQANEKDIDRNALHVQRDGLDHLRCSSVQKSNPASVEFPSMNSPSHEFYSTTDSDQATSSDRNSTQLSSLQEEDKMQTAPSFGTFTGINSASQKKITLGSNSPTTTVLETDSASIKFNTSLDPQDETSVASGPLADVMGLAAETPFVGISPSQIEEIKSSSDLQIKAEQQGPTNDVRTESPTTSPQSSIGQKQPPPAKTQQEITLAELKTQRAALIASLAAHENVQQIIKDNETPDAESRNSGSEPTDADVMGAANKIVNRHIKLLHEYNEIRDVGQGLMGLIADQRGVRIVEVQDEFGIESKD